MKRHGGRSARPVRAVVRWLSCEMLVGALLFGGCRVARTDPADSSEADPDSRSGDMLAAIEICQDLPWTASPTCPPLLPCEKPSGAGDCTTTPVCDGVKCGVSGICHAGFCRAQPWDLPCWFVDQIPGFSELRAYRVALTARPGLLLVDPPLIGILSQEDALPIHVRLATLERNALADVSFQRPSDVLKGDPLACSFRGGGYTVLFDVWMVGHGYGTRIIRMRSDLSTIFEVVIEKPELSSLFVGEVDHGRLQVITKYKQRLLLDVSGKIVSTQDLTGFGQPVAFQSDDTETRVLVIGKQAIDSTMISAQILYAAGSASLVPAGPPIDVTAVDNEAWKYWNGSPWYKPDYEEFFLMSNITRPIAKFLGTFSEDHRALIGWHHSPQAMYDPYALLHWPKSKKVEVDRTLAHYGAGLVALAADGALDWRLDLHDIGSRNALSPPVSKDLRLGDGSVPTSDQVAHRPWRILASGSGWMVAMSSQYLLPSPDDWIGDQALWWLRLDFTGVDQWSRYSASTTPKNIGEKHWMCPGTDFASATTPWGALVDIDVLNDAFGHRNAAESGVCAMLDADSCDDNNACTRDDCDAKLGCIHTPIPEGGSCTANGAVCKAGVCVK